MKVPDVGSKTAVASTRKKGKVAAPGGEFSDHLKEAAGVDEASEGTESSPISGVDAILSIQEAPDATQERSRGLARKYGENLLMSLDDIRLGLLSGSIPKDKLVELAQTMRNRRQQSDDPRLNEILDEVELRAEVEIAKLTRDP